jgi:hypothetical protein
MSGKKKAGKSSPPPKRKPDPPRVPRPEPAPQPGEAKPDATGPWGQDVKE